MGAYQIKKPIVYDIYEGEYPCQIQGDYVWRGIFKASGKFYDGFIREDLKVREYIEKAKKSNIYYGLYHFLLPNSLQRQFDVFMKVGNECGWGQLPPIVDVECKPANFGLSNAEWGYQVKTFLDMVQNATGQIPMIYTSAYYWYYVKASNWSPSTYPLWVAQYPYPEYVDSNDEPYLIPDGWTEWSIWQYAEDGRYQGYPWNDLNSVSQSFREKMDSVYGQPPNPQPVDIDWVGKTKNTATPYSNVRENPDPASAVVGTLFPNTEISGTGELVSNGGYTWMNIVSPLAGWTSVSNLDYAPAQDSNSLSFESVSIPFGGGNSKRFNPL